MIIFSSVTKQFGDNPPALDAISFDVDEGELTVITGPSGSGKTSLMRLLTKEYLPTEGEITFHHTPLSSIKQSKLHEHRRKIGVVFQDYKLLHDLNVWENIALALSIIGASPSEIEKRVTDLLKLVGLVDKAFLFPSQLSGGEAQRVSIARALSTAPKVIFADEPTGNLDSETSQSIVKLLEKINKLGTTILVTTHDPVVIDLLDKARHLKLNQGKLIHDSKPKSKSKAKVEVSSLDDEDLDTEDEKKPSEEKKKSKEKEEETKTTTRKRINFKLPSFSFSPFKKSDSNDDEVDEKDDEDEKTKDKKEKDSDDE